ncbi:transposase domain-containing protein [Streptomyces sp. NPDC048385]|uniref:transposase domain-containing protein n=1 Tax=Streptomyces sp. NPDC048385 TaxID=3155145 RepID=UPI00341ADFFB
MLISRLERLGLGVLTRSCPPELVDRVVDGAGRSEKRRRLLSARFTVYFVLGMCLFPQADYLEVLRLVKTGDPGLRPWTGVNKSSLTRARQRLGWTVMRDLFRAVARPLAGRTISFAGCGCWPWTGRCWPCRTRPRTTTPSASRGHSAVRWGIRRPAWSRWPSVPPTPCSTP